MNRREARYFRMRWGKIFRCWLQLALCGVVVGCANAAFAAITISQVSSTNWTIGNGSLNIVFNPSASTLTSLKIAGDNTNLLDPANSKIYDELAKSGLGTGTVTANFQQTPNYIDFYTNTTSNSTNPFAYQIHYVMFNNDPAIHMYEVVNHSATDIAGTYGQGQFLARVNPTLFTNTYQYNVSPFYLGAQTSTLQDYAALSSVSSQPGRTVQDATTDLTGSGLAGNWGSNFYTKYDYSAYQQFWQGQTEYGSKYAISTVVPSQETLSGGPTKQNLMFTNNIQMVEFLSGHYNQYDTYTPPQGVNSSKLYGPYAFRITNVNGNSGGQLYQDAVSSIPSYLSSYDSDTTLKSNGYVPTTGRGAVQVNAANSAGWSTNSVNNTVVLSDPQTSFQESSTGYQYWTQLSATGAGSLTRVVPGTYRMSLYQLGQWGETRIDNVQVLPSQTIGLSNLKFTPENFGSAPPIWTIGTPDRSAHEFLNGHSATIPDLRQYYGAYDYWKQEETLGNPGKIVYYATAVGSTPATNDPNKWIANQWRTFNPGLYDPANGTSDNYSNIAPNYVKTAGGPATYTGSPWEVHFSVTDAQRAQGQFVVLSIGVASSEASLTVNLNGHSETWHSSHNNNAMVRSGEAGYYSFLAFQFPLSDLKSAGLDNLLTLSVSQTQGILYDALRMEITNVSASPNITGWYDYEYITGANTQLAADDTRGQTLPQFVVPEPPSGQLVLTAAILVGVVLIRRPRHF